jgi:hypothetical protein
LFEGSNGFEPGLALPVYAVAQPPQILEDGSVHQDPILLDIEEHPISEKFRSLAEVEFVCFFSPR